LLSVVAGLSWLILSTGEFQMADQLNPGDVVQLKSGGPEMTVAQVGNNASGKPTVWCIWFEDKKKMSDAFPPASLAKVR
jgi:uncharacterized protein YodC (DUF2158 family)